MMTCKEAAQLISESKDRKLPLRSRMGLRFHLVMCKLCMGYKKQLDLISHLSSRAGDAVMNASSGGLTSDAKERLKERLSGND